MRKRTTTFIFYMLIFISSFTTMSFSGGSDSITVAQSLSGNQTIVSAGKAFELGFFSPGNSSKHYIGIWYKDVVERTIVWVANRERPISDKNSAELKILKGNLVLVDESQVLIWSTDVTSTNSNPVVATLGDDGNLVLREESAPRTSQGFWQSFDNPADTWLPGGKLAYDKQTGKKQVLVSWKNPEDPAPGLFSLELDLIKRQLIIKWNRSEGYWNSGAWNGSSFTLVPEIALNYNISNISYVDNDNMSYYTYSAHTLSHIVMDVSGRIKQKTRRYGANEWNMVWSQPRQQCEVYAYCGAYGICNQNSSTFCSCLPGFRGKSDTDRSLKDYSGGCVREIDLQHCGHNDKFFANYHVHLPDNSQSVKAGISGEECESVCLNNCSCTAYSYNGKECSVWNGEILNLRQLSENDGSGRTIHVRVAAAAHERSNTKNEKNRGIIIGVVVAFVAGLIVLIFWIWDYPKMRESPTATLEGSSPAIIDTDDLQNETKTFLNKAGGESRTGTLFPSCSWEIILAATENFSDVRKLGQGGFGPVYKGTFPGGQEIAVKRLSRCSMQGINEFQTEVSLIAKLQHRNLVCLLGYCIKENEKILLYEYMPNKSLDAFIFDQKLCKLLTWKKRFNIILGIARGVLYLHHDSRLRIIHRDLKTSNILLDEDMNPKISDFGMARIVEGKGIEASTNKVVGTYGYMSPEYASDGLFSIKSDVFSFGVVVLEIISGKKNTGFYQSTEDLNLLAYVWRLWNESKVLDIVDPLLHDSCEELEVIKCINIGLLCVEEDPDDRPTMSNVVYMFSGENAVLPVPKQPAFAFRRRAVSTSSSSQKSKPISSEITMSVLEGR